MAKKKIAPKGKPTAGKAAKKSAGKSPVKTTVHKATKGKPTKSAAGPKKTGKAPVKKAVAVRKKVVVAKKNPVPAKKKVVAAKAGKGVAKKPVKAAPFKKTAATPTPKASPKSSPKAAAKVVVAPKPVAKAYPIAPKAVVEPVAPAKAAAPAVSKPAPAVKAVEARKVSTAVAEHPAPKPLPIKKRPAKERVVMEFYLRSTPTALYELISNPSGFSEWYCDDVDVRGDQYTFIWDQEREVTTLIGRKLGEVIRFRRNDDEDPEAFFELRVRIDAMTNETALVVTDHAWPNEVDKTRNLWVSQIHSLQRVLGA
ncbi:MAG TPA: START-like domain-containing protein [Flavobacteriales bacterium]|nr:START-like domain-containing protein [Flavobacteriales bacterium]